jgi:hypothetical protein
MSFGEREKEREREREKRVSGSAWRTYVHGLGNFLSIKTESLLKSRLRGEKDRERERARARE